AASAGIPTRVLPGSSILTPAAGVLGLQTYKFGRTTPIPFPSEGFGPTSPLEVILENRRAGLHSLVLLDLREDGTFLLAGDAIGLLLGMAAKIGIAEIGPRTLACALSRVGSPEGLAVAGPLGELPARDLGRSPPCLVIPGPLHFLANEALIALAVAARVFSEAPSRLPRGDRSSRACP